MQKNNQEQDFIILSKDALNGLYADFLVVEEKRRLQKAAGSPTGEIDAEYNNLTEKLSKALVRIALSALRKHIGKEGYIEDAKDLVSMKYENLFNREERVDNFYSRSWTILNNAVIDKFVRNGWYRRRAGQLERAMAFGPKAGSQPQYAQHHDRNWEQYIPSREETPLDHAMRQETAQHSDERLKSAIEAALVRRPGNLPINLAYLQHVTTEDIVQATGKKRATIDMSISRFRRDILQHYSDGIGGGEWKTQELLREDIRNVENAGGTLFGLVSVEDVERRISKTRKKPHSRVFSPNNDAPQSR